MLVLWILGLALPAVEAIPSDCAPFSCALLDSIEGAWCCERLEAAEYTPELPIPASEMIQVPWMQMQVGVDIRFESYRNQDSWRLVLLMDSILVIAREVDDPIILDLECDPAHMSVSPFGSHFLIYHDPQPYADDYLLTVVDIESGRVQPIWISDHIAPPPQHFSCMVTDEGAVMADIFQGGWMIHASHGDVPIPEMPRCWFATSCGNLIALQSKKDYSSPTEIFVMTSDGDTVMVFNPGRNNPIPAFSPSGDVLINAGELGISLFGMETGTLLYAYIFDASNQVPVISNAGLFWACSFGAYPCNNKTVLAGSIPAPFCTNVVLEDQSEFWSYPRALAVSDSGHVLCSMELDVKGLPGMIRYLLVDLGGEPLWFSRPLLPTAGSMIPTRNVRENPYSELAPYPLIETPLLADISSGGCIIAYWDYDGLRIVTLSNQ